MMTIDVVRQEVARIHVVAECVGDEQSARRLTDALFESVLRVIAGEPGNAAAFAREALRARDARFRR